MIANDSPTTPFGQIIDPPINTMDSYSLSQGAAGSGGAFQNPCQDLPTPPIDNIDPSVIGATPANKAYCDPIYLFQYADKHFSDAPQLGWPQASFQAIALLSTVTQTTDGGGNILSETLTVYDDGVNYGFNLSVPEPGSVVLLLTGVAVLVRARRRTTVAA